MKQFKKVLGILLIAVLAIGAVACGGDGQSEATPTAKIVQDLVSGITDEQLQNYVIKYDLTTKQEKLDEEGNNVRDEFGINIYEDVTVHYVEVGYNGIVLKSNDGGEYYMADTSGTYCFTVTNQADLYGRGYFCSANQFMGTDAKEDLTELGEEEIAGYKCKHYNYKSGLFNYDMYYNEELQLTMKYVSVSEDAPVTMVVTELNFGTIDYDTFAGFQAKLMTPSPAPTATPDPAAEAPVEEAAE